jgi:hypothetical protein
MRTLPVKTAPSRSWHGIGSSLMAAMLLCLGGAARAQDAVGTVTHLSGLTTARRDDGSTRLLAERSVIHEGETIATEADTYVEVEFVDDATLILGPASRMQVTRYSWNPEQPAADRVVLELLDGSMRSVTGRLGKRNHEAIRVKVPGSEIAVHGTDFIVQSVPLTLSAPSMSALLSTPPVPSTTPRASPPGLYVQVIDGLISMSNKGGSSDFTAGQFGYTANFSKPPVVVPRNPSLAFTPPPAFNTSIGPSAGQTPAKANTVDCVVR